MSSGRPLVLLLATLLALSTWAVYAPAVDFEFVDYDDPEYVSENPEVAQGLARARWALAASHGANWHPLTTLSHMLDVELYGLDPAGHHRSNVLLHVLNTLLLFAFLRSLTGALWRSLAVALLFALHPLHVESVAWVSARKDLLSAAFGLLSLAAYVRYARSGGWRPYLAAMLLLGLGLLCKPMLVTWPFVFLLLDDWPLSRMRGVAGRSAVGRARLLLEKLPPLALALASCVVTYLVQRSAGAMAWAEDVSLSSRLAHVPAAYLHYLRKALWPDDLAVLYPHPGLPGGAPASALETTLATLLLVGISGLVLRRSVRGHLRFGWLFFLGTLVPVIGIVQVGAQAAADRYTYIPLTGLFIAFAWSVSEWVERSSGRAHSIRRIVAVSALAVVLVGLVARSSQQLRTWHDSLTLFESTLSATGRNPVIENELGSALQQRGDHERAIEHFRSALAVDPEFATAANNLGVSLASSGRPEDAQAALRRAIALDPTYGDAYRNLGVALLASNEIAEAELALDTALRLDPDRPAAMSALARVLLLHPDLERRDPERALALAERAVVASTDPSSLALDTLAAAYASAGRFDEAIAVASRALERASARGDPDVEILAERLRELQQLRAAPGQAGRSAL